MKWHSYSVFLLLIYSCSNKASNKHNELSPVKDSLINTSDTFDVPDLQYKASLQKDIRFDTLEMYNKKHVWATIVFPKFSKNGYPQIHSYINGLVQDKKSQFDEEEDEYDKSDSLQEEQGCYLWLEPLIIFNSSKLISIAFEDGRGISGMPAGFEFKTINFDLEKKKQIQFGDFFKFETVSDSAFWAKIIGISMHQEPIKNMKEFLEFRSSINFAFDNENVYFFFDKYDIFAGGQNGGIRRKYINHMIKERYR